MDDGRTYVAHDSAAAPAAAGLAWLWRLGPVLGEPDPRAVGIGTAEEASELRSLVKAGRLLAAIVFAPDPGSTEEPLPARRLVSGIARFDDGARISGEFAVLDGGEPVLRSSLGLHAVVCEPRTLVVGAEPSTAWTLLGHYWLLEALANFLTSVLDRPLVLLPPVGCVRLDDAPGTAEHLARGTDHSDHRQARRMRRLAGTYMRRGAVLNVAVAARALDSDRNEVPLEERWPNAVAAIADGVATGAFEPVGHGYLHIDTEAFARGQIEPREFAHLDEAEAGRRIDAVVEWQREVLGRAPSTFVAPAWGYSSGTLDALARRELPAWLRPVLGPLRAGDGLHETMDSAFRGIHGLDFAPFASAGRFGLPPTPVLHGSLFDLRPQHLRASFDVLSAARLAVRRDIVRLPLISGMRWIGASALVRLLDEHSSIHVRGSEVDSREAPAARLMGPRATLLP